RGMMTMSFKMDSRKALLAGIARTACLGFTLNAQAQTCTVNNWSGKTALSDADAGTQGATNRRYGGPCGLQVDIDGTARFVTDGTPSAEASYIARFYTFLDNAGSDPMILFAADDGTEDQIQVWYISPNAGELTLRVYDNGGTPSDLTYAAVGPGWHSVEFVWNAAASADIRFSVDGATDLTTSSVDTSGLSIANAHLGNVDGTAAGGGTVDFDDFDSRRTGRPGRLLVADADDNGTVDIFDAPVLRDELAGTAFAPGQPDCDENGEVDIFDATCLRDTIN